MNFEKIVPLTENENVPIIKDNTQYNDTRHLKRKFNRSRLGVVL